MTCRDVTRLVASDELEKAPLLKRSAVRLHWLVCAHCRRFRRELAVLAAAARIWASRLAANGPDLAFEARLLAQLGGL